MALLANMQHVGNDRIMQNRKAGFSEGEVNSLSEEVLTHLGVCTLAMDSSWTELQKVRYAANHALDSVDWDRDVPLMMMDVQRVLTQFNRWKRALPRVELFYAVKCNSDAVLLRVLQSLGVNFDCATAAEMDLVIGRLRHDPRGVIYSNPCKLSSHLRHARQLGVDLTIVDNVEEVTKVRREHPQARVLVRLACVDSSAQCPMSAKFGAPNDEVAEILAHAARLGLAVAGVDFHVGSGCQDPESYRRALLDARRAFDLGLELGHPMALLDLGGGYPALAPDGSCSAFDAMAALISGLVEELFPADSGVRVIAEPGRFFAGGAAALLTKIHSKCVRGGEGDAAKQIRYYMNDGLYGSFNCVLYDHQHVTPHTLAPEESGLDSARHTATFFGPTCDGFDKIMDDVATLPELACGDHIVWLGMGAYTSAAATTFNGFPTARFFYYKSADNSVPS